MRTPAALDWLLFAVGLVLVTTTWFSVIGTLIVPRPVRSRVSKAAGVLAIRSFALLCRPVRDYRTRDRLLAWQAPFSLFIRLVIWVALFVVGYCFMLVPFTGRSLSRAFDESGSALFTLGYAAPSHSGATAVVYIAAFSGLVVVALQIGYLPTLYSAFNRREAEVTLLGARGGEPAWGPELLARTRFGMGTTDGPAELAELYRLWERWAADVTESHATYLTLCWLRSPSPEANWLISLLAVMDAAALQLALSPSTAPALRARLVLRSGFTCVRQLSAAIGVPAPEDADPDAPIHVTYAEFEEAVRTLRSVGFPVEVDTAQAWPHFRGWRVNYESAAYALAYAIDAPPALWSGPRRWAAPRIAPRRPANRLASDANPSDPQVLSRNRPQQ